MSVCVCGCVLVFVCLLFVCLFACLLVCVCVFVCVWACACRILATVTFAVKLSSRSSIPLRVDLRLGLTLLNINLGDINSPFARSAPRSQLYRTTPCCFPLWRTCALSESQHILPNPSVPAPLNQQLGNKGYLSLQQAIATQESACRTR